jgi:hypothetical protein
MVMWKEEKVMQFKIALGMSSIAIRVTDKLCHQLSGNFCLNERKHGNSV